MAIAIHVLKKRFKDLSVEELEEKYNELKKDYCFNTKEEQINYIIKNYLNGSIDVNNDSTKIALEELLKEKTGKEYKIEQKRFEISLSDIIDFITNTNGDPFWNTTLLNYFQKLNEISEEEKIRFLVQLVQDNYSFNEFTKEILKNIKDYDHRY